MSRTASLSRSTAETRIELALDLDGNGNSDIETGVGFFDHMLTLLARHSLIDLTLRADGDTHVDDHHTVEDVGICFGKALLEALGDKSGIARYGHMTLPMEETLVTSAVDLSGRMAFVYRVEFPSEKIGTFDTELVQEFWTAVSANGLMNLISISVRQSDRSIDERFWLTGIDIHGSIPQEVGQRAFGCRRSLVPSIRRSVSLANHERSSRTVAASV